MLVQFRIKRLSFPKKQESRLVTASLLFIHTVGDLGTFTQRFMVVWPFLLRLLSLKKATTPTPGFIEDEFNFYPELDLEAGTKVMMLKTWLVQDKCVVLKNLFTVCHHNKNTRGWKPHNRKPHNDTKKRKLHGGLCQSKCSKHQQMCPGPS